jgi:putative ABC transport system ATP-binding protein
MKNTIKISNVSVIKSNKKILSNIDLLISAGERLVIHGSSGAGKSTLLKCLLLFETLSEGEIFYNDTGIDELNVNNYRLNFSYISQKLPYYYGTVKEFLYLPLSYISNKNLIISKKDIEYYFDRLTLNMDLYEKQYNKLSDGEKQRVCIVQALILDRRFLILDEVTSNLDRKNKEKAVNLISENENRTIITVSHDICWDEIFTRKVLMEDAEIVENIIK